MTATRVHRLSRLEGRRVCLSLVGGRRIDDCELVSAGSGGRRSVWIFQNGEDEYLALGDVIDYWESRS